MQETISGAIPEAESGSNKCSNYGHKAIGPLDIVWIIDSDTASVTVSFFLKNSLFGIGVLDRACNTVSFNGQCDSNPFITEATGHIVLDNNSGIVNARLQVKDGPKQEAWDGSLFLFEHARYAP